MESVFHNVPAVAEPAQTCLLKYCTSRNQATYALFLTLLVAGWDGGRRRRPQPATDFVIWRVLSVESAPVVTWPNSNEHLLLSAIVLGLVRQTPDG